MRNLFKQSCGLALILSAVACGSNDDAGTEESQQSMGGSVAKTTPSAGKSGSNSTRAGTGATGTAGVASTARAGSPGTTQPAAAGRSGVAGKSAAMADEDAGVPVAGSTAGSGAAAGGGGATAGHSGAAAGSGGTGPKAGSGGSGGAAGSDSATAATFTEVYALISTGCAGGACHVKATTPGGMLSMADKATAYMNLVNVDATQCRGEKRVVPSDPAKSELLASLKHTQVGSCARTPRMPDNMPQWKDSDIALVQSWIEAGAQNN